MTVAAITSTVNKVHPFQVNIHIRNKDGKVLLNQIRTIDKRRLDGKIAVLDKETMRQVERALKIYLALT